RIAARPDAAVCRTALCPDQRTLARAAPHRPTKGAARGAEGGRAQYHRTRASAAKMSTILLVDDDPDILKLISLRLTAAGHSVKGADSGEKALAVLAASRPELVITDLKMGGMDGLTLFDEIRKQAPTLPVIILTAHGTIPEAVAATRRGVFGFQSKPFDGKHLLDQVEQALRLSGVAQSEGEEDWRRDFVTQSPKMENVLHQARLVAQSEVSVFIQGASGTGKELLARAIHRASPRSQGPFVAVNCAAIPENLLESELFGHRKGSFTGATYDHKGLVPAADGGTLFLDEIGDMPLALQAKLLRVRQLVNVIEQAVALCPSGVVPASLIQQALKEEPAQLASLEEARGAFEREYLVRILRITGGSVTRAAKLAQRNRTEFYKLLERHKLEPKMFKPEKG